jgi:hypothetical protein
MASEEIREVQARAAIRTRWPHFVEMMHAKFRTFVNTFDEGLVNSGRSKKSVIGVIPANDSITATATSSRVSVTITSDPDRLTLKKTYTILGSRDPYQSDLPFYCRLGDDDEIEIHDSLDDDRIIPISTFVYNALSPLFSEVLDATSPQHPARKGLHPALG